MLIKLKYILLLFVVATPFLLYSQKDSTQFVTTWKTDNPGNTNDSTIMLNYYLGYTYNYDVDWNDDGVFDTTGVTGNAFHTYSSPGTYTIRIRGQYPRLGIHNNSEKLLSIDQWGINVWADFNSMFLFCKNVVLNATDAPDLSGVTNLHQMFAGARSFNGNINHWDVSNITNMEQMFASATSFNSSLNNWDVSSVTNMNSMFASAISFNGNVSSWDVSSVTNMEFMFSGARSFNGNISNWDLSSVKNTRAMFQGANAFNGNVANWDVSADTSMAFMFNQMFAFNTDISNWDVSSVKSMKAMFQGNSTFNKDISSWDVSSVKDMSFMFGRAYNFNQDLSRWDVDSVLDMESMFYYANLFDQNLGDWNVTSVTNMTRMFDSTSLSIANYDSILIAWQAKPHQLNVSIGVARLEYCIGANARSRLIFDGWNFVGDTTVCITTGGLEIPQIEENMIEAFPNPTEDVTTVLINKFDKNKSYYLYNSNGVLMKNSIIRNDQLVLDLEDLPQGLYYLKIGARSVKIVVSR